MNGRHGKKRKSTFHHNGSVSGPTNIKQNRSDENSTKVVTDINVEGFAESRAVEIQALTEVVKKDGGNHMAFQKLPKHMRRRAMSHNIKRVPRRLHQAVKSELEKTKPPGKRPSRHYRRRPKNLLAEYERRKRKIGWLETHIWHAKRFKMVQKWNYKLPLHPNEKSIRACYRAVTKYCLMEDVSYENYIEIKGPQQTILENFSHLVSNKTGPTFAAKMTLSGTRQGKVTLYAYDSYPFNAIGQVTFLWQSRLGDVRDDSDNYSTLWICCHPSFYAQALVEINKCFNRSQNPNITLAVTDKQRENQGNVSVVSLKDHLVKFRFYGPASNLVLSEVLQLVDIGSKDELDDKSKVQDKELLTDGGLCSPTPISEVRTVNDKSVLFPTDKEVSRNNASFWWKDFYTSSAIRNSFREQTDVWSQLRKCQSPAEAPPNCVLSLTVRDPRVLLPPKKNSVLNANTESMINPLPAELFTAGLGFSPLWDSGIRERVQSSKVSEQKLNEMKSQQSLPGCPLQLGDKESRIPIILIQRPGTSSVTSASSILGYASGWDLIIPSGWAMAFWVAFVYRGARVGGVREAQSIALQGGSLCEPFDVPDTLAGREQLQIETEALQSRHDRRPPAKRPNYIKLGFQNPFTLEFDKLVKEWGDKAKSMLEKLYKSNISKPTVKMDGFYVLRDRKCLKLLNSALTDPRGFLQTKDRVSGKVKGSTNILEKLSCTETGREIIQQHALALIPVHLNIHHRGIPTAFGHICLPSLEDLHELEKNKSYSGPMEKKHEDPEQPIRKEEKKMKRKLRRKKKQRKINASENIQSTPAILNECIKELSGKQEVTEASDSTLSNAKVKTSNIKPKSEDKADTTLLGHNSRMVSGFVRNGDFNFSKGQGCGVGFCSLVALLHLLEQQGDRKSCLVLVRNSSSFQYRFASIYVVA